MIALILRGILIVSWYQTGQGGRISSDATDYIEIAKNLNTGNGFSIAGKPTTRRPPMDAFFMAFLMQWMPFPLGVYLVQAFLSSLSCVLLYFLGRELFDSKTGFLAGIFFAVDYMSARQTLSLLPELLFVFFLLLAVYFVVHAKKERSLASLFLSGLFAGLSLLTKDSLTFYFPLVAVWILSWRETWKRRIVNAGTFVLGVLILVAPWIVRNCQLEKNLVLITVSSGHTLYLGNNPTVNMKMTGQDWGLGLDTELPQDPLAPPLFSVAADRFYMKKGLEFIKEDPKRFLVFMAQKSINMWRPYRTDSPVLAKLLIVITYVPVLLLGLYGLFGTFKRWPDFLPIPMLMGYLTLIHAVTVSSVRYRFPIMPFFMIFAAYAVFTFWRQNSKQGAFHEALA